MTEKHSQPGPTRLFPPRRPDQVVLARPLPGDHKQLVRAALEDTLRTHDATLRALAKV